MSIPVNASTLDTVKCVAGLGWRTYAHHEHTDRIQGVIPCPASGKPPSRPRASSSWRSSACSNVPPSDRTRRAGHASWGGSGSADFVQRAARPHRDRAVFCCAGTVRSLKTPQWMACNIGRRTGVQRCLANSACSVRYRGGPRSTCPGSRTGICTCLRNRSLRVRLPLGVHRSCRRGPRGKGASPITRRQVVRLHPTVLMPP
jgi:hypothetical protein